MQRYLKCRRLNRRRIAHFPKLYLRKDLQLVPLPKDGAPVAISRKRYKVLLLLRRRECAREELVALDGQIVHLWLGQRLLLALALDLVDGDLGAPLKRPLAHGKEATSERECQEVDLVDVFRARDESLVTLIQTVDYHVVPSNVDKVFLFVHIQRAVNATVAAEDKFGCHGDTLHAHVSLSHMFVCMKCAFQFTLYKSVININLLIFYPISK